MNLWSSLPLVQQGLLRIQGNLEKQIARLPAELANELIPYVRKPGKQLRAGLTLLASGNAQGPGVDEAAVAVELLHLASLIHDDVLDEARLRRGEPSLYAKFGTQKAVLYGDLLLASCFQVVTQNMSSDSAKGLAALAASMVAAEIYQYNDKFKINLSSRRVLRKTAGKTALLFSLSLYSGSKEGGKEESLCNLYRRAGYWLGMAFQLQDDYLDWCGKTNKLGKPIGEDVKNGIYTYPVILALRHNNKLTKKDLSDLQKDTALLEPLIDKWNLWGIWTATRAKIDDYWTRAITDLQKADPEGIQAWDKLINTLRLREV